MGGGTPQDISVRGKFTDPKTGKQKTMTKRLKVLKMGAPFSHPHKVRTVIWYHTKVTREMILAYFEYV